MGHQHFDDDRYWSAGYADAEGDLFYANEGKCGTYRYSLTLYVHDPSVVSVEYLSACEKRGCDA